MAACQSAFTSSLSWPSSSLFRLFRQQHPRRNGILLDAFTAPGNVSGLHTWQARRAVLSTDHVQRQTHTTSRCPSPACARHCYNQQTPSAKDATEAKCCFTRGIKSAWLLSTYPTEEQLFLLLRCTQTLVIHDKTTLQSGLVFLLKLLMQNTAYIRNALIQYGKSYVLSLSLIVNKAQNTDFFCRHEY